MEKKHISKRKLIISMIVVLSVMVIAAITTIGILRYRTTRGLSKTRKNYYNTVVLLYNEAISNEYEAESPTNEDYFVSYVNPHIHVYEQFVLNKSFKFKRTPASSDYKNACDLTYYGINNNKQVYSLKYDSLDNEYSGKISLPNYSEYEFSTKNDSGVISATLKTADYDYSVVLKDNIYTITKTDVVTLSAEAYRYDVSTNTLILSSDHQYVGVVKSSNIQISGSISNTIYQALVSRVASGDNYYYEYKFSSKTITVK